MEILRNRLFQHPDKGPAVGEQRARRAPRKLNALSLIPPACRFRLGLDILAPFTAYGYLEPRSLAERPSEKGAPTLFPNLLDSQTIFGRSQGRRGNRLSFKSRRLPAVRNEKA